MRCLLFFIFVATTPVSMAALSGRVDITGLRYELTDLRPEDGIAPSHVPLGFQDGRLEVNLNSDLLDYHVKRVPYDSPFGSWSADLTQAYGKASGSVTWTGEEFRMSIGGLAGEFGSNRGGFYVNSFAYLSGQLTAFTAVKVTLDYEINLHADPVPGAGRGEHARGDVLLLGSKFIQSTVYANPDLGPQDLKREGQLSFSQVNDSSLSLDYTSEVLGIGAVGRPELIPEPSTSILMLAGLSMLCVMAKRHVKA